VRTQRSVPGLKPGFPIETAGFSEAFWHLKHGARQIAIRDEYLLDYLAASAWGTLVLKHAAVDVVQRLSVFFGFWLSHVPVERFDAFWSLIASCLEPSGRVFFVDDAYRTPEELIEGEASSTIRRRLKDGTPYRAVKVPYRAAELEARLGQLGWRIQVTQTAGPFYWGTGGRAAASSG
jgi:hypothetical protein